MQSTEPPKLFVEESLIAQKLRVTSQWKVDVKTSGYPKPEISWKRNGESLSSSKHCALYFDEESSTIAIYSLAQEDTATYPVLAKNVAGQASLDLNLRVIGKFDFNIKAIFIFLFIYPFSKFMLAFYLTNPKFWLIILQYSSSTHQLSIIF